MLAGALAIALVAPSLPLSAQVRLPSLGEAGADEVPLGAERRLGEQIMRELRRDPDFLEDPVLSDHVGALWARLLQAARQRGDLGPDLDRAFAWELFLVRDRALNAFALPGGFVGLHLGLIAATGTADELASVMAHELSHVTQRHIARGIGRSQRDSAVGMAAMVLGVLLASRANNPNMAQAAIAGGQAAMIQGQLNFSRDMEREADRIGWGVFDAAGFEPSGMASMFDLLERAARLNDSGNFPYLRTHPLTVERLAEARSRLPAEAGMAGTDTPAKARTAGPPAVTAHDLLRARAAALMTPSAPAWQDLVLRAKTLPSEPSALYAGALAAMKLNDHDAAESLVRALAVTVETAVDRAGDAAVDAAANRTQGVTQAAAASGVAAPSPSPRRDAGLLLALLRAELAMARGAAVHPGTARTWLDRADAIAAERPGSGLYGRSRLLLRAELDVQQGRVVASAASPRKDAPAGQPKDGPAGQSKDVPAGQSNPSPDPASTAQETLDRLRSWVSAHPADATAWEAVGRLEQAQGRSLRAQRALAEAQAARGDLDGAIDRLRAAQAASRAPGAAIDFIEASIIDARLRLWQAQRRELAGSMRGSATGSR